MDGVLLSAGDRVLIKNQSGAAQNGVYVVQESGPVVRASDMNEDSDFPGSFVLVQQGGANAGTGWICSSSSVTVGFTAVEFTQFTSAGATGATGPTGATPELSGYAELAGAAFTGNISVASGSIAAIASSQTSDSTANTWGVSKVVMTASVADAVQPTLRPDGSALQAGDIWITW
jgi:hypothetical protein